MAEALSRGWKSVRGGDVLRQLPITDGGDGFGEILAGLLGARPKSAQAVDAAGNPRSGPWWWDSKRGVAIIEAARINGLALLPPKKYHPFDLDTSGLGAALLALDHLETT